MPEIKPVKIFTNENPCTKIDLHNCFAGEHGYRKRAVVEARGEIGLNAPKYLIKKNFVRLVVERNVDYYELTPEGAEWLHKGLQRFLELHPERIGEVAIDATAARAMRRSTRTRPG